MVHRSHATPSVHPNKWPPLCPSPLFLSPPIPHQPSDCSLYLRISYSLSSSLSVTIFFPLPFPQGLLLSFSRCTYERKHMVSVFLRLTYFTQHNTFQFHPRCCKCHDFILSHYGNLPLIKSGYDGFLSSS